MVNVYRVKGRVFNITLNDKVIQKGWYLIVTDLGQEYLVQRNYSLSSKSFFRIYQTEYSLYNHISDRGLNSNKRLTNLGIAIVLSACIRWLTPFELWLGPTNHTASLVQGSINVLILVLVLFISFFWVSWYRKIKLKNFLRKQNADLSYIGKVRSLTPLKTVKEGIGFW